MGTKGREAVCNTYRNEGGWDRSHVSGLKQAAKNKKSKKQKESWERSCCCRRAAIRAQV
jgi:hypothetical protein